MNVVKLVLVLSIFMSWDLSGQSAEEYHKMGEQKFNVKDYKMAIFYYSKAIEKNTKVEQYYLDIGMVRYIIGDNMEAISALTKALEFNINNAPAYLFRASAKNKLLDFRGAYADATKGLNLGFDNDEFYHLAFNERAFSQTSLKDYTKAVEDYNKAIQYSPKNGNTYYLRACVKLMIRDKNGACLDFSKAGELGYSEAYKAIKNNCV